MVLGKLLLKSERIATTRGLKLKNWDPDYHAGKSKEDIDRDLVNFSKKISKLQYKLFADNSKSLLIVLQGVIFQEKMELFVMSWQL
jgi:hypothetical protein